MLKRNLKSKETNHLWGAIAATQLNDLVKLIDWLSPYHYYTSLLIREFLIILPLFVSKPTNQLKGSSWKSSSRPSNLLSMANTRMRNPASLLPTHSVRSHDRCRARRSVLFVSSFNGKNCEALCKAKGACARSGVSNLVGHLGRPGTRFFLPTWGVGQCLCPTKNKK